MHNFIQIGTTWIRTSAITKVGNNGGISNSFIYTTDGNMVLTELSVQEIMDLISKSESRSRNSTFGRPHSEPPRWSQR